MSLTLKILVSIFTLAIGIIPLFGNLLNKDQNSILKKFTFLGWIFFSSLILLLVLSFFQLYDDNISDEKTDHTIDKTSKTVDYITKSSDTIKKDIRVNVINRLENLDKRTLEEISRREGLLEEFRKVNETLERTINNEKSKIERERPFVNISKNIEFKPIQGKPEKYGIEACFINTGVREANLFRTRYFLFETNEKQSITNHLFIDDISLPETIPASNKSNSFPCMKYGFFEIPKTNPDDRLLFLLVKYAYKDMLTNKEYREEKLFYWHSLAVDSLSFRGATTNGMKRVTQYLKDNKLITKID